MRRAGQVLLAAGASSALAGAWFLLVQAAREGFFTLNWRTFSLTLLGFFLGSFPPNLAGLAALDWLATRKRWWGKLRRPLVFLPAGVVYGLALLVLGAALTGAVDSMGSFQLWVRLVLSTPPLYPTAVLTGLTAVGLLVWFRGKPR